MPEKERLDGILFPGDGECQTRIEYVEESALSNIRSLFADNNWRRRNDLVVLERKNAARLLAPEPMIVGGAITAIHILWALAFAAKKVGKEFGYCGDGLPTVT